MPEDDEVSLAVVPDTKGALAPIVDLVRAGRQVYDEVKGNAKPTAPAPVATARPSVPKWAWITGIVVGVVAVGGLLYMAMRGRKGA